MEVEVIELKVKFQHQESKDCEALIVKKYKGNSRFITNISQVYILRSQICSEMVAKCYSDRPIHIQKLKTGLLLSQLEKVTPPLEFPTVDKNEEKLLILLLI